MTALVKYEAAVVALAEARSVDEVKSWIDKAEAMRAYMRISKNKDLEVDAAEIRIRAERRLGEMILDQKESVGLNKGTRMNGGGKSPVVVSDDHREIPRLADAGITKDVSSRAQKLAAVPAQEFENEVGEWRGRVQAEGARVSTRLQAAGEKALGETVKVPPEIEKLRAQVASLKEQLTAVLDAAADLRDELRNLAAISDGEEAKRLRDLTINLKAVESSRDVLLSENAQLKNECKRYMRKLGIKP